MLCTRDEQVGQKIAVMATKGMRRAPLSDFIDVSDEQARGMTEVYIYGGCYASPCIHAPMCVIFISLFHCCDCWGFVS